jgi:hypothetical protein
VRTKVLATIMSATCLALGALGIDAAAACTPGRTNDGYHYHDGWYRSSATIPGGTLGDVRATIYELSPYVAFDASFAYVMLFNDASPEQYVQVGWLKDVSGARHVFDEWTDNSSPPRTFRSVGAPFAVGGFTPYEVLWQPSTQRLEAYAGGAFFDSHVRYFTIRRADEFGEIHSKASQMPGGTNQHEQFTAAYVQNLNGQQYDFAGTTYSSDPVFKNANASSRREDVWDGQCTT